MSSSNIVAGGINENDLKASKILNIFLNTPLDQNLNDYCHDCRAF